MSFLPLSSNMMAKWPASSITSRKRQKAEPIPFRVGNLGPAGLAAVFRLAKLAFDPPDLALALCDPRLISLDAEPLALGVTTGACGSLRKLRVLSPQPPLMRCVLGKLGPATVLFQAEDFLTQGVNAHL
jgi:hypothetical protein